MATTSDGLPKGPFSVIYADPPWRFGTWSKQTAIPSGRDGNDVHYATMTTPAICRLGVRNIVTDDACLFLWASWPMLEDALAVMQAWGFEFKTCAFDWTKAHAGQIDMFRDDLDPLMGMGFWTRSNSEPCLLGTRGKPKRKSKSVLMSVIEPRREHSRKPDIIYSRIMQLVDGPYLEMFARRRESGWEAWGNEVNRFDDIQFDFDLLGPDERIRAQVKSEGRLDLNPGPLF